MLIIDQHRGFEEFIEPKIKEINKIKKSEK